MSSSTAFVLPFFILEVRLDVAYSKYTNYFDGVPTKQAGHFYNPQPLEKQF